MRDRETSDFIDRVFKPLDDERKRKGVVQDIPQGSEKVSERNAEAFIENGKITITLKVYDIGHIAQRHDGLMDDMFRPIIKVVDVDQFAKDVVFALNAESEDGATVVHEMFDKAIISAVDNGSAACEMVKYCDYCEKSFPEETKFVKYEDCDDHCCQACDEQLGVTNERNGLKAK